MKNFFKMLWTSQKIHQENFESEALKKIKEEKEQIEKEIRKILDTENGLSLKIMKDNQVVLSQDLFLYTIENKSHLLNEIDFDRNAIHHKSMLKEYITEKLKNCSTGMYSEFQKLALTPKNSMEEQNEKKYSDFFEALFELIIKTNNLYKNDEFFVKKSHDYMAKFYKRVELKRKEGSFSGFGYGEASRYDLEHFYNSNLYKKLVDVHYLLQDNFNKINEILLPQLMKRYKDLSAGISDIKLSTLELITQQIENFKEENLPPIAQKTFKEIQLIYNELSQHNLETQEKLHLENLYTKKTAQVMGQYIALPEQFKEKLKDEKETPDTLLIESLIEIKKHMSQILERVDNQKYNELKVTNRYLKAM